MKATFVACLALALSASALAASGRTLKQDSEAPSSAPSPVDVLNFALNLEYLEGEFYSCAASGRPLPEDVRGGGPPSTGCEKAQLGSEAQAIAEEIAADELAHVRTLRSALGDQAVPIPALNIGSAFADAANAAFNATESPLSPPFSPYLNDLLFWHGAFIFEDVGVTAYLGGAPLLAATEYLLPAAKILAVEAYHAGTIRTKLFELRNDETPYNVTVTNVVQAISDLRDSVDGDSDDDDGIESEDGGASIVPADENGLVFARTPAQVLAIVTLGTPLSGGGFFPEGLNGAIGSASSR